jgi:hypothetical protein
MNTTDTDTPTNPPPDSAEPRPLGVVSTLAQQEAGVPRRFGVSVLLVITAMYAVLFGVLQAIRAPFSVFFVIALFFTTIGLGQAFLFKGKRPRKASVLVGACFFPCLALFMVGWETSRILHEAFLPSLLGLWCSTLGGAVLGYTGGGIVDGVFLVIDKLNLMRIPPSNTGDSD